MKIALASSDFDTVTGHAGRAKRWLIYTVDEHGQATQPVSHIELSSEQVLHHHQVGTPHPLDDVSVVIATSAGDGFLRHMEKMGIQAILTGETAPDKAIAAYFAQSLPPPKPRPIGSLICKTIDLFSHR